MQLKNVDHACCSHFAAPLRDVSFVRGRAVLAAYVYDFFLTHMAPKAEKKPKEPDPPPSAWMPLNPQRKEFVACLGAVVRHNRNGCDAVRGKQALSGGRFRLIYEISPADTAGFGICVGVCAHVHDPPPAEPVEEGGKDKKKKVAAPAPLPYDVPSKTPFVTTSLSSAWGYCPSSGQLMSTDDVRKGLFEGSGLLGGSRIHPVPMRTVRCAAGMEVAIELYLPALDPVDAAMARRTFATGLNPLDMRRVRASEDSLAALRPSLGFRINGGELVDSGVQSLPPAVYPWASFTRDGDTVTLRSIEKVEEHS